MALACLGWACAPLPRGPDGCADTRPVWVVSHGIHTGLVFEGPALRTRLPSLSESLRDARFVEVGWGDARYYPERDAGFGTGLTALLVPGPAVLQVAGLPLPPAELFAGTRFVQLQLARAEYEDLLGSIVAEFRLDDRQQPEYLGPPLYGAGGFYRAHGRFHLFNTCNTWVESRLAAAGRPLSHRTLVTESGLFAALQRIQARPCAGRASARPPTLASGRTPQDPRAGPVPAPTTDQLWPGSIGFSQNSAAPDAGSNW